MSLGVMKKKILHTLLNLPGYKTDKKIVVIESDDWGSIRMPNKSTYQKLLQSNIPLDKDLYCKYDTLASASDFTHLFEILSSFKDKNGNPPKITANTVVANPDFEKIAASNFQDYYSEPFTETLKRYYSNENTFQLWEEGLSNKLFIPQFHAKDHVNVNFWLDELKNNHRELKIAFDEGVFGIPTKSNSRGNYMATYDFNTNNQLKQIKNNIVEGLKLFEGLFNYKSTTTIAPCYIWNKDLERLFHENHVAGFQGIRYQYIPVADRDKYKKKIHFNGTKNRFGQRYLVRNTFFEPTHFGRQKTLNDISLEAKIAFKLGKPLIIGAHRLNFIGAIEEKNRHENLAILKELLGYLLSTWPDIEFMSSDQLLDLMNSDKK